MLWYPYIGNHLVDDRGLAVGGGRHRFEILSRGGDRVGDRGRIALIGTLAPDPAAVDGTATPWSRPVPPAARWDVELLLSVSSVIHDRPSTPTI